MSVAVGDLAPTFTLPGTGERDYSLEDYRGRPVVLVFYPGDDTPVCTVQLNTYTKDIAHFAGLDAQVLALSPQGVESHERFAEKQGGFAFPLLADTEKVVGQAYGVVGPLGFYRRSIFVVDAAGTVVYAHRSVTGLSFKPTDEIVAAIKGK